MSLPDHHFRHVMLYEYFKTRSNKVNAAEAARNIRSVYGEDSPSESNSRNRFSRFKSVDYIVEDEPRSGRPSKLDEGELEAIRKDDPRQTKSQMTQQLSVSQRNISTHLKDMGVRYQYGREVPHPH